ILGQQASIGALVLDNDFNPAAIPTLTTAGTLDSVYGGGLFVMGPNFTTNINQAAIGGSRTFFGNYQTLDVQSTTMGAGLVDTAGAPVPLNLSGVAGIYRFAGFGGSVALAGADGMLSGSNLVEVGSSLND